MRATLILLAAATAAAQTGVVEGRVVSSVGNEPVRRASVALRHTGQPRTVETTSAGVFRFEGLAPGAYTISAQRAGFLDGGAQTFELGPDGRVSGIVVTLTPTSVISGRILDADGDPISGVTVRTMRTTYGNGRRQVQGGRSATSDDRGNYRLFGLAPGRYYIGAQWRSSPQGSSFSVFYPGTTELSGAERVKVAAGEERRGVDVRLRPPGLYSVRIRVTNAPDWTGTPPDPGRMFFPSLTRLGGELGSSIPMFGRGNVFEARDVLPGRYVFTARLGNSGPQGRRLFEVVNSDVDLDTALAPALEVMGKALGVDDATAVSVRLEEPDVLAFSPSAAALADGTFRISGVPPDRYILRARTPEGCYLKSIRQGETLLASQRVDLTAAGLLTLQFADDGAEVAGLVVDARDRPASGASVVLEPLAPDWPDRLKILRTDTHGNFRIHDVAPGEYRVLAWDGEEPDDSTAVTVRAEANGDHRITLRIP